MKEEEAKFPKRQGKTLVSNFFFHRGDNWNFVSKECWRFDLDVLLLLADREYETSLKVFGHLMRSDDLLRYVPLHESCLKFPWF